MIETGKKSCTELITQRLFLAIVSSVALQFFFVCCFVLFSNVSTDYARWLQETWTTVTSLRMWAFLIVLSAVTVLHSFLCMRIHLRAPSYYKSRFAKLGAVLTIQNLSLRGLHVIIGGTLVWLHMSLTREKYSSLTTDCEHGTCLVEEYYFLLISGLWSGLYFSVKYSNFNGKHFSFPIIPQTKFFQLRRRIYSILPMLIASSIWSSLYNTIAYYFLGVYYRAALLSVTYMQIETEPLDTASRLLSLMLMLYLWLHQFMLMLTISSTYVLFEIYLTEWIPFKFGSGAYTADSSELMLIDALSMDKVPIMQHLGYLDLFTLAQKDKIRRNILFTLSQPGGHPYNWNCVVEKCTGLLNKFSTNLNAVFVKSQDQPFCYRASTLKATTVPPQQTDRIYHMRKLVPDVTPVSTAEIVTKEALCSSWSVQKFVKQKQEAFVAYLFSKPIINYIFGEQDENKIRYILLNGQLVIWAAEALSSLSVFSLSEDSYGIVQKDVTTIINTLLSVKQTLDKLQKSTVLTRRIQADDKWIREILISLRSAIKRSLYRIVTNFEPYITDLSLEPQAVEQLQGFLNYKE